MNECARVARTTSSSPSETAIRPTKINHFTLGFESQSTRYTGERLRVAEKNRCPYCVVGDEFRPMTVLPNGRLVCENCGHTSFPEDEAFKCPCSKCLKSSVWDNPNVRRPWRRPS